MGRFNYKEEDFDKIKEEAEKFYSTIGEVYCPYFEEKIPFNAMGIRHLKFKSDGHARPVTDQYARLKLLSIVPRILTLSRTVQGIYSSKKLETHKTNSRWEKVMKIVKHYEFIAVLENIRVKVMIKEVEGGQKHFLSVIPYWRIDKNTNTRVLNSGDMEQD